MTTPTLEKKHFDALHSAIEASQCVADGVALAEIYQNLRALAAENERLKSAWHVDTMARKDGLIADQEKENDRLKAENERLRDSVIRPGIMRCAKCKFEVIRKTLNMGSGTVTAGNSKTEPCPNGCGPLWPITWKEYAQRGDDAYEFVMQRMIKAEDERDALKAAAPPQAPAAQGWYCAHCQRGVTPNEVTYSEQHTECGRVITGDAPPQAPALPDIRIQEMREFISGIAMQKPEKPDHWSSCSQCEHNINAADEIFVRHTDKEPDQAPAAGEQWRVLEPFLGKDVPNDEVVRLSDVKALLAATKEPNHD